MFMLTFLLTSYHMYGQKAGYVCNLHLTVFQDYTQLNEIGYTYVDS